MLLATIGLLVSLHRQNRALREETERLTANYRAMTDTVTARHTASGRSTRTLSTLTLTPDELTSSLTSAYDSRLTTITDLGIKAKRVNELTTVGTVTQLKAELTEASDEGAMPTEPASEADDCALATPRRSDEVGRKLAYHDPWIDIVVADTQTTLTIRDTLTLVEHRVPRRFWFLRFGTKLIRREAVASCPYTEVVMAEQVLIRN